MQEASDQPWRTKVAPIGLLLAALALLIGLSVVVGGRTSPATPRSEGTSSPELARAARPLSAVSSVAASRSAASGFKAQPQRAAVTPVTPVTPSFTSPTAVAPRDIEETDVSSPFRAPGLCSVPATNDKRTSYLAQFRRTSALHPTLYAHPAASPDGVRVIEVASSRLRDLAMSRLGLDADLPIVLVYPDVEALRDHSCTSKAALAYYDGAIHLAAPALAVPSELIRSLQHEFAHHVLVSNGVGAPLWFQEGTAMWFAGDRPPGYYATWRKHPLDLTRMVNFMPHTASVEEATIFDAQAYVMVELLDRLCLARERCNAAELATALTSRAAKPSTLFEWAISRRGADLVRSSRLGIWLDYAELGDFLPATKRALLSRATSSHQNFSSPR